MGNMGITKIAHRKRILFQIQNNNNNMIYNNMKAQFDGYNDGYNNEYNEHDENENGGPGSANNEFYDNNLVTPIGGHENDVTPTGNGNDNNDNNEEEEEDDI